MQDAMGSSGQRADALRQAAKVWTGQLVDLTASFRDLKVGTLDLGDVPLLFDVLAGKAVR